jgi:3-oxoacyl-[acyl-carrier protein] reductase
MLLKEKTAIITGCSRGIGRQTLIAFAQQGANLWACSRTETPELHQLIATLAQTHAVSITPLFFDLTDAAQIKQAVKAIAAAKSPIDVLVNNAGITHNALFQMTSSERMRELFEVNFFAQAALTQYIVRLMLRQKSGSVINISSSAAIDANPGRGAYGASKAALNCLTRTMAHELAEHNIRVNAIAPGVTETDMLYDSMLPSTIDAAIRQTRLKRLGQPADIANAAVFLASDLASYMTGEILRVDGGLQN